MKLKTNKNLDELADSIFSELSKGRDKFKLKNFVSIKHGFAFKGEYFSLEPSENVLVTPGNFCIGGGFKESKCKYYTGDIPKEFILKPRDLIVTMTDLSKEGDTLGYAAFVPEDHAKKYLHNQRIGLIETINELPFTKGYLYRFLRSDTYHASIVNSATGSTVKHTAPKRILDVEIPIPAENTKNFQNALDSIDLIISAKNEENKFLTALRDNLLPKLLSGEIDLDI